MQQQTAFPWPISLNGHPVAYCNQTGNMSKQQEHPKFWSKGDVEMWLKWCIDEYSLEKLSPDTFCMNGKALLLLSKEDFKERSPNSGDVLYNTLQKIIQKANSPTIVRPPPAHFAYLQNSLPYGPLVTSSQDQSPRIVRPEPRSPMTYALTPNGTILQSLHTEPFQVTRPTSLPVRAKSLSPPTHYLKEKFSEKKLSPASVPEAVLSPAPSCTSSEPSSPPLHIIMPRLQPKPSADNNMSPGQPLPSKIECFDVPNSETTNNNSKRDCRLLWEFIGRLLADPDRKYAYCIRWEDEKNLVFRILNPSGLAHLWGLQKNRNNMTYEKLSRALRYYYRMNIIEKVPGRRLTYRFIHPPAEIKMERIGIKCLKPPTSKHPQAIRAALNRQKEHIYQSAADSDHSSRRTMEFENVDNKMTNESLKRCLEIKPSDQNNTICKKYLKKCSPDVRSSEVAGIDTRSFSPVNGLQAYNQIKQDTNEVDHEQPQDLSVKTKDVKMEFIKQENI